MAHEKVQTVPCPFFRRRFTDSVESAQLVLRWVQARHKSLSLPAPPASGSLDGKWTNLEPHVMADAIRDDFVKRRAYINGRLTRQIYADDCLFDGPDPDMPVRGLKKYCLAVSGLFDAPRSECQLLGEPIQMSEHTITCHWRLSGRLRLPWHPAFKPYLGFTTYHLDPNTGLISSAIESWSIHPVVAFLSVLLPRLVASVPDAPEMGTLDEWLSAWLAVGAAHPPHLSARSALALPSLVE